MLPVLHDHRLQRAFSLLETVVVLGLITILAVAIIPNLDLQQGASKDASAQSSLEATLDSQTRVRTQTGEFADPVDPADLSRLSATNPELTFVPPNETSADPRTISLALAGPDAVVAAALSGDTTCWVVRRDFAAAPGNPTAVRAYIDLADPSTAGAACSAEYALTRFTDAVLADVATGGANAPGVAWQRPYRLG